MPTEKQRKQRLYIDMLMNKALQKALEDPAKLNYDPQGRVLIDVALTPDEIAQAKNDFGRDVTPITTVSLDVLSNLSTLRKNEENPDQLADRYAPLRLAYREQYRITDTSIESLKECRGSILPLQQEFYFHLGLATRTYQAMFPERFSTEAMTLVHKNAMARLQPIIMEVYHEALAKALVNGTTDERLLAMGLDKGRKILVKQAHEFLFEELVKETGVRLTKSDLKKADVKHVAEKTTATGNDLLHSDNSLELITWISGSDTTAHDRGVGKLADRQIRTFAMNPDLQRPSRTQIRIPSLDVKEGVTAEEAIADIQQKLETINTKYDLAKELSGDHVLQRKAFTYNLHTALNDNLEGGKNKQSQGARYIFTAAHNYNAKQIPITESSVFCFVQNISVNGFGDTLGYDGDELKTEATLMAEMAMLYNLVSADDLKIANIGGVFSNYEAFLAKAEGEREAFFSQSKEGKQAINLIQTIKLALAQNPATIAPEADTVTKAKAALKLMLANNLHQQHEYAKLIQSLSVFIEEASISGCKSGNERAQAINGRVAVLDSVAAKADDPIVKAMLDLANTKDKDNVAAMALKLKEELDKKYDLNLQGAVAMISAVDQGAAAKVNAKQTYAEGRKRGLGVIAALVNALVSSFNRNYAEELLPHLQQDHAGSMQAHKGLTKNMIAFWPNEPKSFFQYMKSKLGTFGAIASMVLFPIAALGAIFHHHYQKEITVAQNRVDALVAEKEVNHVQKIIVPSTTSFLKSELEKQSVLTAEESAEMQMDVSSGVSEEVVELHQEPGKKVPDNAVAHPKKEEAAVSRSDPSPEIITALKMHTTLFKNVVKELKGRNDALAPHIDEIKNHSNQL